MVTGAVSNDVIHALMQEHIQLRAMFKHIRKALADKKRCRFTIAGLFTELTEELIQHFAHEEKGGYFHEVIEMAPRLESAVNTLREQHTSMLLAMDDLRRRIDNGGDSEQWWRQIAADFDVFVRYCDDHEMHEDSLAQEAYVQDIGALD